MDRRLYDKLADVPYDKTTKKQNIRQKSIQIILRRYYMKYKGAAEAAPCKIKLPLQGYAVKIFKTYNTWG